MLFVCFRAVRQALGGPLIPYVFRTTEPGVPRCSNKKTEKQFPEKSILGSFVL